MLRFFSIDNDIKNIIQATVRKYDTAKMHKFEFLDSFTTDHFKF